MARSLLEGSSQRLSSRQILSFNFVLEKELTAMDTSTAKRITPYTIRIHTPYQPIGDVLSTDCKFHYCMCAIAIA